LSLTDKRRNACKKPLFPAASSGCGARIRT
jgi:hypothetical protein